MTAQELFAKNYRSLDIKFESLPEYTKKKVVYTKQNPAFVVAWIKDHLKELLKEKETFMKDFVGQIVPKNFNVELEENSIKIDLEFCIDDQEDVELSLVGKLHRSEKGEFGIEWEKAQGNDYWLTAIENSLNGSI